MNLAPDFDEFLASLTAHGVEFLNGSRLLAALRAFGFPAESLTPADVADGRRMLQMGIEPIQIHVMSANLPPPMRDVIRQCLEKDRTSITRNQAVLSSSSSGGSATSTQSARAGRDAFDRRRGRSCDLMVAGYSVEGESFRAEKPKLVSDTRFASRPRPPSRDIALHPDGQRFAVAPVPEGETSTRLDKVVFIFNFFDELRRIAPGK